MCSRAGDAVHEALIEHAGLVCPGCRRPSAQGMLQFPLATGDVFEKQDCFVIEGFLVCSNADCRRRYPILEGVPIVLRDIAGWWSFEKNALSRAKFSAPPVRDFFEALASNEVGRIADRSLLSTYHDLKS